MKTPKISQASITRHWHVVDASDAVLGRLATKVATLIRGKHKAAFTPHMDLGDFVVVLNADKVKVTGKKESDKLYWHYTGFPGGGRTVTVEKQRTQYPERIILHAVKGMLPKGPLGRQMIKKLKIYNGSQHPHAAQQPQPLAL